MLKRSFAALHYLFKKGRDSIINVVVTINVVSSLNFKVFTIITNNVSEFSV